MDSLTPKQEAFAICVSKGMTYADSYRESYDAENSNDNTIYENASRLMADSKITARIDILKAGIVKAVEDEIAYTAKDCFDEFHDIKERAKKNDNLNAEIKATENKGKLNKLFVEQKEDLTDYSGLLAQLGKKAKDD